MCPVADRRSVELYVPLAHFDEVKTWDVKGDDLKKLLFFSRNVDLKYPKDISRQKAKLGVIQGPIAHCHTIAFEKMSHWTEVTDAHLLKEKDEEFGGTKWAKEWIWMTEEAIDKAYMCLPEKKFKLIPEPWKDVSSRS